MNPFADVIEAFGNAIGLIVASPIIVVIRACISIFRHVVRAFENE